MTFCSLPMQRCKHQTQMHILSRMSTRQSRSMNEFTNADVCACTHIFIVPTDKMALNKMGTHVRACDDASTTLIAPSCLLACAWHSCLCVCEYVYIGPLAMPTLPLRRLPLVQTSARANNFTQHNARPQFTRISLACRFTRNAPRPDCTDAIACRYNLVTHGVPGQCKF